ncbi:hypothetical protein TRAPUB_5458 [Trametes pubescens]|uniref:Uncharacterized protein n=1 Tax=Trametes pubescens TaxID=154538 RepID=A0A1M2V8J4_TRAPU|nr:hypothetical protein TRAPUB_5458 [Trametes pubescens]
MPKDKSKNAPAARPLPKATQKRAKAKSKDPGTSEFAAVDSSQWRESMIPEGITICKSAAMKQYRLKSLHLEDIDSDKIPSLNEKWNPMELYDERAVERKAWELRGGPEGFEAYLERLRQAHIKTGKNTPFTRPAAYGPLGGAVYIVRRHPSANGRAEQALLLEQEMPLWLWDACHRAMDRQDGLADVYGEEVGRYARMTNRESPMQSAAHGLAKLYPPRPMERLPSSPAVDRLRDILAEAPSLPRRLEWGEEVDGMWMKHTNYPEEDYEYEWAPYYLDRLFAALIEVIEVHGIGDAGWCGVRWEVYDKV